jgi:hypothetical protein
MRPRHPRLLLAAQVLAVLALAPLFVLAPVLAGLLAATLLLLGDLPVVPDLLVALRPLALPLIVVAVGGAFDDGLSVGVRLLVGLLAGLALLPWEVGRWLRDRALDRRGESLWRETRLPLLLAGTLALALIAALAFWPAFRAALGGGVRSFDELGGPAIAVALTAMVTWGFAIVFRAIGFMRSVVRTLFGLALALLAVRGLMSIALLPEVSWLSVGGLAIVAGCSLVVLLLAELLAASRVPDPGPLLRRAQGVACALTDEALRERDRWRWLGHRRWLVHGWGMALTSTVLLVVALALGAIEVHGSSSRVAFGREQQGGGQPARPPGEMTDLELARTFAPVLQFPAGERWDPPRRVDAYVRAALRAGRLVPRPPPGTRMLGGLPASCPANRPVPCYKLDCPSVDDPCADSHHWPPRIAPYRGTAYVRVVRRDAPPPGAAGGFAEHRPDLFDAHLPPYRDQLSIVVQYWLFYPFDDWAAPILTGRLDQQHAGDWEAVTVGLSDRAPLFVAYSQHCGGRWERWGRIPVANAPLPRTHPLVAVAIGSHANYERSTDVRSPNWTTCSGLPRATLDLLSYVWNIRDRTGSARKARLGDLVPVDARTPPMTFPGTWGVSDRMTFVGFRSKLLQQGAGPLTPTRQPLWIDPLRTILCRTTWRWPMQRQPCSAPRPS